jgi:hypothetical protein
LQSIVRSAKTGPAHSPFGLALGHMKPYDHEKGARTQERGLGLIYSYKVGFLTDFGFLINVKPIFNNFWELLGSFGA